MNFVEKITHNSVELVKIKLRHFMKRLTSIDAAKLPKPIQFEWEMIWTLGGAERVGTLTPPPPSKEKLGSNVELGNC